MKQYTKDNWPRLLAVAILAVAVCAGVFPDPMLGGAVAMLPLMFGETAPDMKQVLLAIDESNRAFTEFKKQNDDRLKEIAKKGDADGVLKTNVENINQRLTELGDIVSKFQAAQQRLALAAGGDGKVLTEPEVAHQKALNGYLRRGDKRQLEALGESYGLPGEKTASVGSDQDGGYFVTPDLTGRLVLRIYETSDFRRYAAVQTISTDALEGVVDNQDTVTSGWVGEQASRPATATPKTGKWRIPVFEQYAMPETTQQLLDDAAVDVEAWLMGKVQDKMVRTENTAFWSGDGVTKPRGISTYATAATADATRAWGTFEHVATGTSGGFGAAPNGSDKLVDLVHSMKDQYRGGAVFFANRLTWGAIRKLRDGVGNYIWLPSMTASTPSTLLGYPIAQMQDMPDIAANSLSIMFANLSTGYQIVDRQGFRVLRDPFTNKPYVRFYTTKRVGGDVLHFEAIKFLKFA